MAGGTLYFFNLNNFNSRILYGMRPAGQISKLFAIIISIHAPLTGCDYCPPSCFLAHTDISIHAPLTGCDRIDPTDTLGRSNFNPRTPYGMRPAGQISKLFAIIISIHAPLTGCDYCPPSCFLAHTDISIHAPLTGCDRIDPTDTLGRSNFNPRTPYGMRRWIYRTGVNIRDFNPRTPYGMRRFFYGFHSFTV